MLKMKRISEYSIRKALEQIDEDQYLSALESLLESKRKTLRSETNKIKRNYKLLRFAQSKGYETDLIMKLLKD